ncbi:MAG: GNAT family N-acetyltransferase [Brucellaceae bacterium]|nr:GNAT family N-acetyltransferase [Brucellaceae bacterium]
MSAFTVRPVEHGDLDGVIALTKDSWARTYDPVIGAAERAVISDAKHVPALFAGEIESDDGVTLVAVLGDGTPVGHLGGSMNGNGGYFLDRLHVLPAWQGKGVADALVEGCVQACAGRADYLELTVLEGNQRAIGFYRRAGFVPVGESSAAQGLGGVPAQRLRKPLNGGGGV